MSPATGHICQPVSGGRHVFCLQHRWLQVSGRHDSAHPAQPEVPLCVLHGSHQQETTVCLHLFPEGECDTSKTHEKSRDMMGGGGEVAAPSDCRGAALILCRDYPIKIALELNCGLWTLFQDWHLKFLQLNDRLQCNNNHSVIFYNCNLVIIVSLKLIIT